MTSPRAIRLSSARVRSKVRAALAAADGPAPFDAGVLAASSPDLVRSLPEWVGRFGILEASGTCVLWCEPRPGPGETFPSQLILDVPAGRYFVDSLDAGSGRWISRESAEGGPLVAGVPFTGGAVLVRIAPVGV